MYLYDSRSRSQPCHCLRRAVVQDKAHASRMWKRDATRAQPTAPWEIAERRHCVCLTIRRRPETRIEGLLLLGPQFLVFLALCGGTLLPGTCSADSWNERGQEAPHSFCRRRCFRRCLSVTLLRQCGCVVLIDRYRDARWLWCRASFY
jgi:hypothetical protein